MDKISDLSTPTRTKKWVSKPMVSKCGVCRNPADNVKHYGAVACYSCRAFFRRAINNNTRTRTCARKANSCLINSVNRNNCKKCRYEKCLKAGMRPEKVDRVKKKHLDQKKGIRTREEANEKKGFVSHSKNLYVGENEAHITDSIISDEKHCEDSLLEECLHSNMLESNQQCEITDDNLRDGEKDINTLVDECLQTETLESNLQYEIENRVNLVTCPSFQLTHEEEFKVFELFVRKEHLMDGLFRLFFQFPGILESFQKSLISVGHGEEVHPDLIQIIDQRYVYVESDLARGGTVRQSLDMFDEFKNVSENIKNQVLQFSMSVFRVCNKALVKENVDKKYFVDQHIAAGVYNNTFKQTYDLIFPNNKYALRSFDPFAVGQFTSPWLVRYEDEVFFWATLESVGRIVKDDVHLGALYSTLILATPGARLAEEAKNDPSLTKVQSELSLLLYRYCKKKYGNTSVASDTTNNLLKLLGDLHICRDIFMFNRLPVCSGEVAEASIEEIADTVEALVLDGEDQYLSEPACIDVY